MFSTPTRRRSIPSRAFLHVERAGISWYSVARDRVRIAVTVQNVGSARSRPTPMSLEVAPLGAFVRWRPLTTLVVPPIESGGSVRVQTEASRAPIRRSASSDEITPDELVTAATAGERPASGRPQLAPDLFELQSREGPHWAGNLNVFIGGRAVERHQAPALRIYPGRANLAMFLLGDAADAYAFELRGSGAWWEAALFDMSARRTLAGPGTRAERLGLRTFVEFGGCVPIIFRVESPALAGRGHVEVHVTQRSSWETVVVEFSLDARAAGPGCYTA